jgi:hypothetical protein
MSFRQATSGAVMFSVFAALLFAGVSIAHDITYFRNFCFSSFDLGIYMEAVQKVSFTRLDPYLSSMGLGFINDHWHPALAISKVFTPFAPLSTSLFLCELLFVLCLAFLPYLVSKKGLITPGAAALLSIYLLINQRQLEATMAFPVHPAVWANALLFFAVVKLITSSSKDADRDLSSDLIILGTLFLAGFFGEQFSFALLGYAIVFLCVSPRKKLGLFAVITSGIWVWFCFSGRALLVGPILHQAGRVATSFSALVGKYPWSFGQLGHIIKFFFEALPLIFFGFKFRKNFVGDKVIFALVTGIFGPLLLGRALSASFGAQYDTLLVCAAAAFAMVTFAAMKRLEVNRSALALSLVFFLFCTYSKFERAYNVLTEKKLQNCVHSPQVALINSERIKNLTETIHHLEGSFSDKNGLVSGNLLPNLVESSSKEAHIFTLGVEVDPAVRFDWVVIEHGVCGDPWPWDENKVEAFIHTVETDLNFRVVKKDPCLFFAMRG